MIAVIADDLTGAAEIGGIGMQYGLTVEINTVADLKSKADLLIIATDTRSMPKKQALLKTAELTVALYNIKPQLIFKKVDSVLRGHVIAELNIHLLQFGLKRALLVPANPAFGRILTNGNYFIDDLPVHLSNFANDPEFAISNSNVFDMLRIEQDEASLHRKDDELPDAGIIIGECATEKDLIEWAGKSDKGTLLAGGAGLFKAMLETNNLKQKNYAGTIAGESGYPALFVCGSAFNKSKLTVKKVSDQNGPVSYMPIEIVLSENPSEQLFDDWADEVIYLLKKYKKAVVAIHENTTKDIPISAGSLRGKKAIVVQKIFQKTPIKELLMKSDTKDDFFLTLKPGSYDWPSHVWDF